MIEIIKGIIIALIAGVIGAIVGGIVYDVLLHTGDSAFFIINKCDTMPHDWKIQCEKEKSNYETWRNLIQIFTGIVPFSIIFLIIIKRNE